MLSYESLLIWILAAGIAQGAFLSTSLFFLGVRNKAASRMLAGNIALMTTMLAAEFLDSLNAPVDLSLGMAIEFAVWPLNFLFMRSICEPGFRLVYRDAYHFAPFAFALGSLLVFKFIGDTDILRSASGVAPLVIGVTLVKIPYFLAYAYFSDRVIASAITEARRWRFRALRWIRLCFLVLYGLIVAVFTNFILFASGVEFAPEPDFLGAILIAASIFSVAYFVIANQRILDTELDHNKQNIELVQKATAYLKANPLFTAPEFSMATLSSVLDIREADLTRAFNARFDGGFNEFVNRLRVAAFDRLLNDPANRERTILDLAYDTGFNSKATFYRVFKTINGVTPTAYRAGLAKKAKI